MARIAFFIAAAAVGLAALGAFAAEPLILAWLAARAPKESVAQRVDLLNDAWEIRLPEDGAPPYATVLQFHGCAGPRPELQRQYADFFNELGYAAIVVDSTGPRGFDRERALEEVCAGKTLLGQERAGDVLAALDFARRDPRFDPNRLVVAGWSHGAWTAMDYLTMDLEDRRPAGLSDERLSAPSIERMILFYPHCGRGALSRSRDWVQTPPTLAFIAGADTIVDADACRALLERRAMAGAPVDIIVYPDAEHAFDDAFLEPEWAHWRDPKAAEDARRKIRAFLGGGE